MEILTGEPLFPGQTQIEQLEFIQQVCGPLPPSIYPNIPPPSTPRQDLQTRFRDRVSPLALDFVTSVLQLDPKARKTIQEVLAHPFLSPSQSSRSSSSSLEKNMPSTEITEDIPGSTNNNQDEASEEEEILEESFGEAVQGDYEDDFEILEESV